jgi:transcriptional regulator with XRE-family HTH domain
MRSPLLDRLPPQVCRSLTKLGRDISIARRKRRLTATMMAERLSVSKPTYLRVERGDPTVGMGVYAMALFVLGLGTPFGDLVDASRDDQALLFDVERLPQRVRTKTEPTEL